VDRRLTAILAADVVGYSRLMERDEAGTHAALTARRKSVLEPLVAKHKGRIVKLMGDGVLAEFASAVNAVQCAAELQRDMAAANAGLAEDRRIVLRIGVNLGDVIVEGEDIYGDGVNIAARIEALAEPGAVYVSQVVMEQTRGKLELEFEDTGEHSLKNIAQPVRVYRVAAPEMERGGLPLPDKPSIAVLPFTNMSGDPEQEYFSDGITEDIITELSRFRSLFVIARNSSFTFKGKTADVREVGRKLGAGYVVEGSVRRSADRLRITAQLIDASSGNHIWAERYDRDLKDIFAVQDEVVSKIVGTMFGKIEDAGALVAKRKRPESLVAYDYLLRGIEHQQKQTKENLLQARHMLEKAIEIDPNLAAAYSYLALVDQGEWDFGASAALLDRALENARKSVALDEDDARCHCIAGYVYLWAGDLDKAEFHHLRAVALNPNDAHIAAHMGLLSAYLGKIDEGIRWLNQAFLLDPYPPDWYRGFLGMAQYTARDYVQAVKSLNPMRAPFPWDRMYLAASYAQLNRIEEARTQLAECGSLGLLGSIAEYAAKEPFKNPTDLDHLLDGLRKAGMPV
jgi:adenylate cyclase